MDIELKNKQGKSIKGKIDEFEAILSEYPKVDCPVTHTFTPGLYIRKIFMPKGSMITSLIHKTEHPYFVLSGKVEVFTESDGIVMIEAPYSGITKPDTRRVLRIIEDTVWVTVHQTDISPDSDDAQDIQKAVDLIRDDIIDKRVNPLLGGFVQNNLLID